MIRSLPGDSPFVERVVEALRAPGGPGPRLARLRRLAALIPPPAALSRALAELDTGATAPCPRCGARLDPDELVKHLWERHRLLLESGRVREPWDVIGQWVADFARTNNPTSSTGRSSWPRPSTRPTGLSRVHRLLLIGGSDDEEAHDLLRAEAAEKNASLCPNCYALVPLPTRATPTPVLVASGRVDGGGFRVELTDRYVFHMLRADTPEVAVFAGPEPGHALTRRGAVLLFLVPLVAGRGRVRRPAAACSACGPVAPVTGVLFAGLMAYIGGAGRRGANPATDRAVDHAWTLLVPRMLQVEGRRADAAFLAGLAVASRGRGDPEAREEQLRQAIGKLRQTPVGIPYVTPLSVLKIADLGDEADDLPVIAERDRRELRRGTAARPCRDAGEGAARRPGGPDPAGPLARADVGPGVRGRAGGRGPADDRAGVPGPRGGLRQRGPRRPGPAAAAVALPPAPALAADRLGDGRLRPGPLPEAGGELSQAAARPVAVPGLRRGRTGRPRSWCARRGSSTGTRSSPGPNPAIRVRARSLVRGGGYELTIDEQVYKFREDPTLSARRLKGWALFLFKEFLPRARLLTRRQSPQGDRLLRQKVTSCPECRKAFLGLAGEIGLTQVPPAVEGVEAWPARTDLTAATTLSMPLLFLIGYRGSGKTTVGRLVADRLGWAFVDADSVLEERHGRTIREIFAAEGEASFREQRGRRPRGPVHLHRYRDRHGRRGRLAGGEPGPPESRTGSSPGWPPIRPRCSPASRATRPPRPGGPTWPAAG